MDNCGESRVVGTDRHGLARLPARPYFDTGSHSRLVTTSSPEAQTWFDRGLTWIYGFNHEESVICFRQALKHDPKFAFAWWGIALASGPFYNLDLGTCSESRKPGKRRMPATRRPIWPSRSCEAVAPVERLLIEAIAAEVPQGTSGAIA